MVVCGNNMLFSLQLLVFLLVLAATCCGQDMKAGKNVMRMSGGKDINMTEYNYIAWLQDLKDFTPCSPIILNPRWLLTTTLCITHETGRVFKRNELHVVAGTSMFLPCANRHIRNVANYFIQPGHTADDFNSLAMIQLSEPLEFGRVIDSMRIPNLKEDEFPKSRDQCFALGQFLNNKTKALTMRKLDIEIAPLSDCPNSTFGRSICTTHTSWRDRTNCPYSRMAMVCKNFVVGFATWSSIAYDGCGKPHSHINWLKVDNNLPWIKSMMHSTSKMSFNNGGPDNPLLDPSNTTTAPAASSGHDFTAPLILVLAAAVLTVAE